MKEKKVEHHVQATKPHHDQNLSSLDDRRAAGGERRSTGPRPAHAATIVVNGTADVIANDGQCTLREAITAANTDTVSGAAAGECAAGVITDTITLPAGTYTLALSGYSEDNNATGDLDLKSDITINGADADTTIIDADQKDRVMEIS